MKEVQKFFSKPVVQVVIVLLVIMLIAYFFGRSKGKSEGSINTNVYKIEDSAGNTRNFIATQYSDAIAKEIEENTWLNIASGRIDMVPFAAWLELPDAEARAVADDFNTRHGINLGGSFNKLVSTLKPKWSTSGDLRQYELIFPKIREKIQRLQIT